ncbi:MAG TPA: class I SAM-dependent methyltransferase [Acidimicrobiales bacterium]|nr:class I SAM-dependent methyltransferase [Acidimicrobiales bacterium]
MTTPPGTPPGQPPGTPPGQPPAELATHQARHVAESFGTDPERYDRARPRYPKDLVDRVVVASPGRRVLDVGVGTGIAARQFQAAGCTVLGVDPDERMAEVARSFGVEVEVAPFETWDPSGRVFDVVVAGQAWHWIEPLGGASKAAAVLRPGGRLALIWNVFQPPPELAAAFAAASRRAMQRSGLARAAGTAAPPGAARAAPAAPGGTAPGAEEPPARSALETYSVMFATASDGIRRAGGFAEPEEWRVDWQQHYSREEWLDFVRTGGVFTNLAPDDLAEALTSIGAAIDAVGGSFTMEYTTVAVTTVRLRQRLTGGSPAPDRRLASTLTGGAANP